MINFQISQILNFWSNVNFWKVNFSVVTEDFIFKDNERREKRGEKDGELKENLPSIIFI